MSQKKGKKKGRRKDDDWEDDVANELEQMQLNDSKDTLNKIENNDEVVEKTKKKKTKGKKGKETVDSEEENIGSDNKHESSRSVFELLDVEDVDEENQDSETTNESEVSSNKRNTDKSKKELSINDSKKQETNEDIDPTNVEVTKTEPSEKTNANSSEEDELDYKKEKRKAKKSKKVADDDEGATLGEEPMMKTAAQKRAEKKEREKKKKEAQKKKPKDSKSNKKETENDDGAGEHGLEDDTTEETSAKTEPEDASVEAVNGEAVRDGLRAAGDKEDVGKEEYVAKDNDKEEGEEGEDKKKKKKGKKKGAKGEDVAKTKKPGRAVIKQMQEALEKAKLEEERLRQEEEAKERALEEAENMRLEKIRLEKERKEKEKQKKKDKIKRQKEEGKFLTKAQKQQKAKQEAWLREQGIEIPSRKEADENARKPVRYGKKSKNTKEKNDVVEAPQETADDKNITIEASPENHEDDVTKAENEIVTEVEHVDDIKDTWDDDDEHQDIAGPSTITKDDKDTEAALEDDEGSNDEGEDEEYEEEGSSDEEQSESESESESEEDESLSKEEREFERAKARIKKRREKAELKRTKDKLRAPVICVMGHVDTGKTKILDKIRHSNVQDGEAGGITQQIGATNVPPEAIRQQTAMIKEFNDFEMKFPGLLIIDTPGHESFSNLRSRGSTLCDMAILVVDIMHGLEPQTIESINLLRSKKTPFIVALNKVDRLFEWKRGPNSSIVDTIKKQNRNTKQEFEERLTQVTGEFAKEGLNAILFNKNVDPKTYISLVPTSAHSGDGMGDLISLIVTLCQTKLANRLAFSEELQCTVLEVKAITGLGTTVDVILTNGRLAESQTIVLGGIEGPIVTQVRALLMPEPLKELRVKNQYATYKEIEAAQGVKITGKELDKALAGSPLYVAYQDDEVEVLKREVVHIVNQSLKAIKVSERGVCVQASTLGSLEALLEFLKTSKIPYCSVSVGPVHKKDVMKASVMLEHDVMFAVLLAFDVKVERDAQELADSLGVKIFTADIIYHLFDKFMNYREELKQLKRDEFKHIAIFPCKLRILSEHIYNSRDPIVLGVLVEGGIVKEGTPVCVPTKEFVDVGIVTGIEANHKPIERATKGMEVCVKIETIPGEAPKMYGRHFDYTDLLVSKISRESIDAVKEYFRDDLQKSDWQLMIELKKLFKII